MATLGGPQLRYARNEEGEAEDALTRALKLARQVEELLEQAPPSIDAKGRIDDQRAHGARMARAMAASLVDELEVIVRGARSKGTSSVA